MTGGGALPRVRMELESLEREMTDVGLPEVVDEIVEVFLQEAARRMRTLLTAIEHREAGTIESAAHEYKSGAWGVRATDLAEVLEDIETLGRLGDSGGAASNMPRLIALHRASVDYLMSWQRNRQRVGPGVA